MKSFTNLLFNALLLLIFACSDGGGENSGSQSNQLAEGKKTFRTLCVACHGMDGKLAVNGAKDFTQSELTLEERIAIITNGRTLMTAYKGVLSKEEIKAVAAYTMELSKGKQ